MFGKKFVYMQVTGTSGIGGGDYDATEPVEQDGEFSIDHVPTNNLPPNMVDPHDRAKANQYIQNAYAAILAGDTSTFLKNIALLRSITFEYDVDYAEKVLEWFGDFERGINSIRASMQGFSTEKGEYKLTELEMRVLQKAKELLEAAGYSLEDIPGGEIIQKMLDAYNNGQGSITISKKDANKVLQFMTQMETKLLPSDMKQEVLAAQLEATNKKRDGLYSSTLPALSKNSYGQ